MKTDSVKLGKESEILEPIGSSTCQKSNSAKIESFVGKTANLIGINRESVRLIAMSHFQLTPQWQLKFIFILQMNINTFSGKIPVTEGC